MSLTSAYGDLLRAMGMNKHGFLPPHPCFRCGKELSGEFGNNPAESYAGTSTGLCTACTHAGPYVVSVHALDGAQNVSHPPHSPSWRRSRQSFVGYPDCKWCEGMGARGRNPGNWGDGSWKRCESCSDRYYQHPYRMEYWAADESTGSELRARYQARYEDRLLTLARAPKKLGKKARAALLRELWDREANWPVRLVTESVRAEVLAQWREEDGKRKGLMKLLWPLMYAKEEGMEEGR